MVPAWSQICANVIQGCSGPCLGVLLCRDEATSERACSTLEAATDVAWMEPGEVCEKTALGGTGQTQPTNPHLPKRQTSPGLTHTPAPMMFLSFIVHREIQTITIGWNLVSILALANLFSTCYAKWPFQEFSLAQCEGRGQNKGRSYTHSWDNMG